ncbi:hypothetical protein ZHAS_00019887 [Anopheles sinensis]|uniref:Uncharacterized protein n=1 Tax=Anopheles sinensis TaxID=74873 RepID=A0A084WMG6_ANOSI|nr:hypothetical protein ZHAS_00019887 [Anopheles sinensis]
MSPDSVAMLRCPARDSSSCSRCPLVGLHLNSDDGPGSRARMLSIVNWYRVE